MNFTGGTSIISGNVSFINNTAPAGGNLIQLYRANCYIAGNVSFLQNNVNRGTGPLSDHRGGAAIYTENSTLFISGAASFVRNRAIAPMEHHFHAVLVDRHCFRKLSKA